MDNRNRNRGPRRRRDRVYTPPGRRLEEYRERLKGYGVFSFEDPDTAPPADHRPQTTEHNSRRDYDRYDGRGGHYDRRDYDRYDERDERYDRRGFDRYDERDERYDRRGYDRYDGRGERYDRRDYDRYDGRGERYDRRDYDRYDGRDERYDRRDYDRYDERGAESRPDVPEPSADGYAYPPYPVMSPYAPPYPEGGYPPFDPYGYFMDEEDYREFVEDEEFEDRYGRDFDRYGSESAPKKSAEKTPPAEKKPAPAPKPAAPQSSAPAAKSEAKSEPAAPAAVREEPSAVFDDDFDDDFDFDDSMFGDDDFGNDDFADESSASDGQNNPPEEPFFAQYRINRPAPERFEQKSSAPERSAPRADDDYRSLSAESRNSMRGEDYSSRQAEYARREPSVPVLPERPDEPAFSSITKYLLIASAVMCLLGGWLIPSGHIIEETGVRKTQRMASFDLQTGFDSLSLNVTNDVRGLPKVYTLPLSESPANKPREDGFSSYVDDDGDTHDTYTDDTISVDCSRKRYTVGEYKIIACVARVKISHPTQLRSAFAGGGFGSTRTRLSKLAQSYNAVVGINGELYNHTGRNNILIRQGTTYRDSLQSKNTLFIDSNGDFIIKNAKTAVEGGILDNPDNKIYQTVSFGPALVIDGVKQERKMDDTHFSYRNPRSAIGQVGPLEYMMVSVEGRSAQSKGLNVNDLATLMMELGCVQAYNLDGGQSSELVFRGKPYNNISNNGERQFSDLLYFGTALPEE